MALFTGAVDFLRGSAMVKFVVGVEEKVWRVHENLLFDRAERFRDLVEQDVNSDGDKEVCLKSENPETFHMFVEWLYGHGVNAPSEEEERALKSYADLYIFGLQHNVEALRNDAMDALKTESTFESQHPDLNLVVHVYAKTTSCPLRDFCAQVLADRARFVKGGLQFPENMDVISMEIFRDVLNKLGVRGWQTWVMQDRCIYHEHEETEKC